ncbi:MAG: hypothetical protein ACOC3V_03555 [bacterium]
MKKLIFIIIVISILFSLTGCLSLVSENKKITWAYQNGFILPEDCPELEIPERQAQPHPQVPVITVINSEGELIELSKAYLMEITVMLFGTIEKYQYLVEIYEREYLNAGGKIMPDLTLEELKQLYKSRLSRIESIVPSEDEEEKSEETSTGEYPLLDSTSDIEKRMTVKEFSNLVKIWNEFQETGEF